MRSMQSRTNVKFLEQEKILRNDPMEHRKLMLRAFEAAIGSVLPKNLLERSLILKNPAILKIKRFDLAFDLRSFDKIVVVGCGKATGAMAEALEDLLGDRVDYFGSVNILKGTASMFRTKRIELNESAHPIPSEDGVIGTRKIVGLLQNATKNSMVICLISGGGSALMPLPGKGISLKDKVQTTTLLLKSGANIDEINCVRKHLSEIKGGRIPKYAKGAQILSLIISDVVGDVYSSIASGPTVPDPTTFSDALKILRKYDLLEEIPKRVLRRVREGVRGLIDDTPKQGDPIFKRVTNLILGDNRVACDAAIESLRKARSRKIYYLGSSWQGEARVIGRNFASMALGIQKSGSVGFRPPCALVWGGESTVTLKGSGVGGRNQEEALAALGKFETDSKATLGFLGTDGKDGFSEAAGAFVDAKIRNAAKKQLLDIEEYLENNNSYAFFRKIGEGLLTTGPTGTNVNDLGIALVD